MSDYFSTGVAVVRDRRWMALIPALFGLLTCVAGAAWFLLEPVVRAPEWGHQLTTALGCCVGLTALMLLWQRLRPPKRRPARLHIVDDVVEVEVGDETRRERLAARRQGWFRALAQAEVYEVSLMLKHRRVLTIVVEDADEAKSVLAAAGVDPERHAQQIALCEAGPWTELLRTREMLRVPAWIYSPALFMGVIAMHAASPTAGIVILGVMSALAAVLVGDTMARVVDEPRVTVGNEGLHVEGFFHRRFIAASEIRRADADERGVVLTLFSDETVILPIGVTRDAVYLNDPGAQDARRDALMELLRRAVTAASDPGASIQAVERRGRALDAWTRSMRETLGRDYRTASYASDTLVDLVCCANAPREQRIGAAIALSEHPDPKILARLRVAIDTCADPALQAAIEAAAQAELDDAKLERALDVVAAE